MRKPVTVETLIGPVKIDWSGWKLIWGRGVAVEPPTCLFCDKPILTGEGRDPVPVERFQHTNLDDCLKPKEQS